MTLVQASICNEGKSVILIGDRLVTTEIGGIEYETEAKSSKIYCFGKNVIGFAGTLTDIFVVKNSIVFEKGTVDEFANYVSETIETILEGAIEKYIQRMTLRARDEFVQDRLGEDGCIPNELKGMIYSDVQSFAMNCSGLIIGLDKDEKAKIYHVSDRGSLTDCTEFGRFSIGSGHPFSEIFFDLEDYFINCSLEEGLYLAYRAKKAAESHTGVGKQTDLVIIKNNKESAIFIKAEDKKNKFLEKYFREEICTVKAHRMSLVARIQKELL